MRPDKGKQETAYKALLDDLQRCEKLGIKLYNLHPGERRDAMLSESETLDCLDTRQSALAGASFQDPRSERVPRKKAFASLRSVKSFAFGCQGSGREAHRRELAAEGGRSRRFFFSSLCRLQTAVNRAIASTESVVVVLEGMAGQKNVIGSKFEDLRDIIALVEKKDRVGVCLDTCHLFAAGKLPFPAKRPRFKSCTPRRDPSPCILLLFGRI